MAVDMVAHRASQKEQKRINGLLAMLPRECESALEIGSRDCYITTRLVEVFDRVTALDLELPVITHERIVPVQGDVTQLGFEDHSFDVVICTEVLEHINPGLLQTACDELSRVAAKYVFIGVPYKQDIRVARTKCMSCGKRNPPFGHLNAFDENKLCRHFHQLSTERIEYVGESREVTNFLSAALFDLANNPYGSYHQEERCGHCGAELIRPPERTLLKKAFTKAGFWIEAIQAPFVSPHPTWIHILFKKR